MTDGRFTTPIFTTAEVVTHLGVPDTTLRRWLSSTDGRAALVHRLPQSSPNLASIPFIAVAETHMLRAFRTAGLSMREIQESVIRLRRELGDDYALASRLLATDGVTILANITGTPEEPEWERARDGQGTIRDVIKSYLKDFTWTTGDDYPIRLRLQTYGSADVVVDPRFAFGQPILAKSKVRVQDVVGAFKAGEPIRAISDEYGIGSEEVEEILRAQIPHAA